VALDVVAWIVIGAAVVLGVPGAMYLLQDSLLFVPQPYVGAAPAAPAGRPVEELEFEAADGVRLRGWLVHRTAPAGRAPLVVYYGGNAEEVSWQATEPWPVDWSLALVNYRGYGASEGKPSERDLYADAMLVLDVLARRPDVDPERVVLAGRSLGAGVATHVAAHRPVAGVVLISPYDSMVEVGRRHYPWLPVRLLLKHPFDAQSAAPSIRAPLLAIAGSRDSIIPAAHSRRLFDAWGGPKRWVELAGADHNDVSTWPAFWPAIDAFLRERQGSAPR
jgi:pimeloyl-ACP methyl ester carboxylesterase